MARKTTKRRATTTTKRTARRTTTKTKRTGNKDMLLVGTKVKDALRAQGCNVSSDALEGLNAWVHWLIEQAATRTTANGRKTVRNHDFMSM